MALPHQNRFSGWPDPRHLCSPHTPVFLVVSSPGSGSGHIWGLSALVGHWLWTVCQDIKQSRVLTETGQGHIALHASLPRQPRRGCWRELPASPPAAGSAAAWLTAAAVPSNGLSLRQLPHPRLYPIPGAAYIQWPTGAEGQMSSPRPQFRAPVKGHPTFPVPQVGCSFCDDHIALSIPLDLVLLPTTPGQCRSRQRPAKPCTQASISAPG